MAFPFAFYAHRVDLILNEKFRATDFKKVFLFHSLKKRWNERELELLQRPEQKEPKERKAGFGGPRITGFPSCETEQRI